MKTIDVGFILNPSYSSIAYVSALEPLMICNQLTGENRYQVENVGVSSHAIRSSLNNLVSTDRLLSEAGEKDLWIVAGSSPVAYQEQPLLHSWLQKLPASQAVGGISSGTYDLAQAGLLNGYRAVIHWWNPDAMLNTFTSITQLNDAFCIDQSRMTCRGGTASLDMMLWLIARQQGVEIAEAVSQHFLYERIGQPGQRQITPLAEQTKLEQPKLAEALLLMEANIEEPLTTDDISYHIKMSRRQLERLFKKHLHTVPSRYYLQLRMRQAREQLLTTTHSIADIGYRCGFSSGAHFSTAYRSLYNITPSEERRLKQRLSSGESQPK